MTILSDFISGLVNNTKNFFYTASDQTWLSSYASILGAGNLFKLGKEVDPVILKADVSAGDEGGVPVDDRFVTETGEAFFLPGLGNDFMKGKGGKNDMVSYVGLEESIEIKLNKKAKTDTFKDKVKKIEHAAGGQEGDVIKGNGGKNILFGDAGSDVIKGKGGRDVLIGGAGGDELKGGRGFDFVSYAEASQGIEGVTIDLDAGIGSGLQAEGDTLKSIEGVIGTAGRDELLGAGKGKNVLIGLGGNDILRSFKGKDQLYGGQGNDGLDGGRGRDLLDGGDGFDYVDYSNSIKAIEVDLEAGTGKGLGRGKRKSDAHNDTLKSIEAVIGSDFDDILKAGNTGSTLDGGNGDDTLIGGDGADTFQGGAGADTIDGGGGEDRVFYGLSSNAAVRVNLATGETKGGHAQGDILKNIESIIGSGFDDELTGDEKANSLTGLSGDDLLVGADGNDVLRGGEGIDTLIGGEGDDRLVGGEEADILEGGANGEGGDRAEYTSSFEGVTIDLGAVDPEQGVVVGIGGDAEGDTLIGIENLSGSAYDDTLTGDDGNNHLKGLGGNDTFFATLGADHLEGDAGFDTVDYSALGILLEIDLAAGTVKKDFNANGIDDGDAVDTFLEIEDFIGGVDGIIYKGTAGDDRFRASIGPDVIDGGQGNDIVDYINSEVGVSVDLKLDGSLGQSQISTGDASADKLISIENLSGSEFDDTLSGNEKDNLLIGNGGADILNGGDGDDVLMGGAGADILNGGDNGPDNLGDTADYTNSKEGVTVDLTLAGPQGGNGDALGDILSGIENLVGSHSSDTLVGNDANNKLSGGLGSDTLTGGAGLDTFIFDSKHPLVPNIIGSDTITDFEFDLEAGIKEKIVFDLDGVKDIDDLDFFVQDNNDNGINDIKIVILTQGGAGSILLQDVNMTLGDILTNPDIFEFL